jgi:hypothetical protein
MTSSDLLDPKGRFSYVPLKETFLCSLAPQSEEP